MGGEHAKLAHLLKHLEDTLKRIYEPTEAKPSCLVHGQRAERQEGKVSQKHLLEVTLEKVLQLPVRLLHHLSPCLRRRGIFRPLQERVCRRILSRQACFKVVNGAIQRQRASDVPVFTLATRERVNASEPKPTTWRLMNICLCQAWVLMRVALTFDE
jgi:hypothetical protein